jgi:hypothetical protein
MNIGKIIKSDSHLNYKCRIYGRRETASDVSEKDYHFGQFVKIKIFDNKYVIGLIFNSQLFNPEYGNFGPRLTNPSVQNFVTIPDFIDETAIITDIHMIGWFDQNENFQDVPPWVIPLNSEVCIMTDEEIKTFHYDSEKKFCLKYYNEILAHTGNFASPLLVCIINKLINILDHTEKPKLKLIQQHILWQQTNIKVKA